MPVRIAGFLILTLCMPAEQLTPAGKAIEAANAATVKEPGKAEHYNALALALARRAREISDDSFYDKAAAAAAKSLELSPGNLEALKMNVWIRLGKHEFADALKLATDLRRLNADDETIYGLLVDANVELGNYKEAEEAAQWMLNVGRASVPGLTRAAYLRELFGDIEGALELMDQVIGRLNPAEVEDRAWTLTQAAHLFLLSNRLEDAEKALAVALRLMPDYHYALGGLAKVRRAQGRHDDAVALLRRRYELAPHTESLFDLGAALRSAGKFAESRQAFLEFERRALNESERWDNANRELITYYADYAGKPAAAVEIARREIARRHDVFTLDAYAWALHRHGRSRDAFEQIQAAVSVGTVEPRLLYHAGAIAIAVGRKELARKYLRRSLDVNARSEVAANSRLLLARL